MRILVADRRPEVTARGFCRSEKHQPEHERSETLLAHEVACADRLADVFRCDVTRPLLQERSRMAHLLLAAALEAESARGLGDLTKNRPALFAWLRV